MEQKRNIFSRIKEFLREVKAELKRVSWPSKNDLYKTTLAVIVSSIFFGIFLFLIDFIFSRLINEIIARLK